MATEGQTAGAMQTGKKMKKHDKKDDLQQKKQQCLSIPGAIWIPIAIKHYETLGCGTAYIF